MYSELTAVFFMYRWIFLARVETSLLCLYFVLIMWFHNSGVPSEMVHAISSIIPRAIGDVKKILQKAKKFLL